MPEPNSKLSINTAISYPVANKLALKLCNITTANTITFINVFLSIYILYKIYKRPCKYKIIFVLCLIRAFLDILDGAMARQCNQQSEFGAKFDQMSDIIFACCLVFIFIWQIKKKNFKNLAVIAIVLIVQYMIIMESVTGKPGVWQDNDLLLKPLLYTSISYTLYKCKISK